MDAINWTLPSNDSFDWTDPSLSEFDWTFAQAAEQTAPGIVGFANEIRQSAETIIDAISRARMQLAMTDYQREKLQVDIDRARAGLPPVGTVPAPSAGLTQNQLIAGAAVLGIVFFVARKK